MMKKNHISGLILGFLFLGGTVMSEAQTPKEFTLPTP